MGGGIGLALLVVLTTTGDGLVHAIEGEQAGEQHGYEAAALGDIDGDGVTDFATGAPFGGDRQAGRLDVHCGRTGERLHSFHGRPGERVGWSVATVGDVDGDGHADILTGAPGQGALPGRVLVWSGATGALLHDLAGSSPGEQFGDEVGPAGDVDGDGHADFLVGASGHDAAGKDAGRALLVSGADGTVLRTFDGETPGEGFGGALYGATDRDESLLVIGARKGGPRGTGRVRVFDGRTGTERFRFEGDPASAAVGAHFVSVVGDCDADGRADVMVSDWQHAGGTGRVWVLDGRGGRPLLVLTGERQGEGFGIGNGIAGDCDGDGHDDLILGAWLSDEGGTDRGKAYLLSGRNGAVLRTWTGRTPGEVFGFDATGLGDVDGDGSRDFLITSAYATAAGRRTGATLVVSGASGSPRPAVDGPTPAIATAAEQAGDWPRAAAAWAAITERNPGSALAWYRLGYARHAAGDLEGAIEAHERAATFPATATGALYNLACAHARLGHVDEALDHLERAVAGGFANPASILNDSDLVSLRRHPRFAALVPLGPSDAPEPGGTPDEFDFWPGDWTTNVRSPDGRGGWRDTGRLDIHVESILDDMAVIEHARSVPGGGGMHGFSLRAFDPLYRRWNLLLLWPNAGAVNFGVFSGAFRHGRGEFYAGGGPQWTRFTFSDISPDSFRWDSATTSDGGRNWTTTLIFENRRRDPADVPLDLLPATGRGLARTAEAGAPFDDLEGTWVGVRTVAEDAPVIRVRVEYVPIMDGAAWLERVFVVEGEGRDTLGVLAWDTGNRAWVRYGLEAGVPVFERTSGRAARGDLPVLAGPGIEGGTLRQRWSRRPDGRLERRRERTLDGGRTWEHLLVDDLRRVE